MLLFSAIFLEKFEYITVIQQELKIFGSLFLLYCIKDIWLVFGHKIFHFGKVFEQNR